MSQFTDLEARIVESVPRTELVAFDKNLLSRMVRLMAALGNPQDSLKIIHVAGTSGKTSTCYYVASLLQSAGFTTGLTISPDIDTVRERAIVNLQPLSEPDWVLHMTEFFALVQNSGVQPSYFEFYMAFAYWLFAKLGLDYAVIETGLGGTYDASNVARQANKTCIITDIGYDHTDVLGNTLAAIASEKAGIIHHGNTVFMNAGVPEAVAAIEARCVEVGASLNIIKDAPVDDFLKRNFHLAHKTVERILAGDYSHVPNLATAQQISIPARAEKLSIAGKTVIMDGSHNPQKLTAFVDYLTKAYPAKNRTIVATIGSNKLKDSNEIMALLRQVSNHIILTSFRHDSPETNYRESVRANILTDAARSAGFHTYEYIEDPYEAFQKALKTSTEQVVITGSFYLLKHIRPHLSH
jgi:dihydrofolate synthase/folylpolyglutamate synthase